MSGAMHRKEVAEDYASAPDTEEYFRSSPRDTEPMIINLAKAHAYPDPPTPQAAISPHPLQKPLYQKTSKSVLLRIDDVMVLCSEISENMQIKAAVDSSAKGAAAAAGGAFVGGLLGGPPGIFIGGALGSAAGWLMTRDKFRPLHQIIKEMTPEEKKELYSDVMKVLGILAFNELADLISKVMSNSGLQKEIVDILISFAKKKLRAKVKCGKKIAS